MNFRYSNLMTPYPSYKNINLIYKEIIVDTKLMNSTKDVYCTSTDD